MKKFALPLVVVLMFVALYLISPDTAVRSSLVTWEYFLEMVFILPQSSYSWV